MNKNLNIIQYQNDLHTTFSSVYFYVYVTYFIFVCLSHIQYVPKVKPNFCPL